MPGRTRRIPGYRLHRPTGQPVVTLARKDHYVTNRQHLSTTSGRAPSRPWRKEEGTGVSDQAQCNHCLGDLDEARGIRTGGIVPWRAKLLRHSVTAVANAFHDLRQPLFGELERPRIPAVGPLPF